MTVLERFLFRGQEALTVVYYLVDADGSPCPVECTCRASSRDGSGIAVVVEGVIEALNEEAAVLFEQETA
ncbi:MAG: hypothetical protein WC877_06765 [Dehalococcoidales bacterium]|jgi:hypothetical protein